MLKKGYLMGVEKFRYRLDTSDLERSIHVIKHNDESYLCCYKEAKVRSLDSTRLRKKKRNLISLINGVASVTPKTLHA